MRVQRSLAILIGDPLHPATTQTTASRPGVREVLSNGRGLLAGEQARRHYGTAVTTGAGDPDPP